MTISPALSIRRCLPHLLAGLVIALPAHHAGAQLPPSRHVVATGDDVPPHGVIGHPGGTPLALDEQGRALVVADAADGTRALLWADGTAPDVIWHGSPDPTSSEIDAASAVASPDGRRVLALGGPLVQRPPLTYRGELRQLRPAATAILGIGNETLDGFTIVSFVAIAEVSNDGAVLLSAIVQPADTPPDRFNALLLFDADGVHTIAGNSSALPADRRFVNWGPLGRSDAGAVFFAGDRLLEEGREDGVFQWRDGEISPVVLSGDTATDGTIVEFHTGFDSSPTGEVLFSACSRDACPAVYRTEAGAIVPVQPYSRFDAAYGGTLNARGDVVLFGTRSLPYPVPRPIVWWHRADAAAAVEILAGDAAPARLNERGDIAYIAQDGLERRDDDGTHLLLGTDARLDDGTRLLSGGLERTCLADDGRIALAARVADGSTQFLCADGDGIHALDAAQDGGASTPPPGCAFAGADLVLLRNGIVERHTDAGVETVLRPGDQPAGLAQPIDLIGPIRTNARGTILTVVYAGAEELVRIDAGGRATRVDLLPPGAEGPASILEMGLTPDDAAVALIYLPEDDGAFTIRLVRVDRDGSRELWRSDAALRLGAAHFRGDIAVVHQVDDESGQGRIERIDLQSGAVEPVLSEFVTGPDTQILSLRDDGDLLLREFLSDTGAQRHWLYENATGALTLLTETSPSDAIPLLPVALGDGGHLLLTRFAGPWRGESAIALAGPPIGAPCPGTATSTGSNDDDGCHISGAPRTSAWPLLIAGALLAVRRFRSR